MSFDQGPWVARLGGIRTVDIEDFDEQVPPHVVKIDEDEQGRRRTRFVATCNSTELDNEANAILIAAAPDLLHALKELLALVQGEAPSLLEDDHHYEMVTQAIAKAEGQ